MAFIRSTDRLVEGLENKFFTEARAKAALAPELSTEESARIAGDSAEAAAREAADGALDQRLDVIEGSGEGSVAKAKQDAKDYADQKVADLVNSAPAVLDTLKELSDALGGDENFATTVANNIGQVDDKIDQEISDRQEQDGALEGYINEEVDNLIGQIEQEATARQSGDNALDGRLDIIEGSGEGSVVKAEQDAKDYADNIVDSEESRAMSAESALDGRLDILEQDPTTKTYVDGIQSALDSRLDVLESDPVTKTYVDGEVSDLQGQVNTEKGRIDAILSAADADKDSFAEIVSLINSVDTTNDNAFAAYVLSNDQALADEISNREDAVGAEESRAMAAESALDGRLDVLESDPTTKTYVDGQISSEQSARQSADNALDGRLDILESDPVTKSYVDAEDQTFFKLDGSRAMTGGLKVKYSQKSANYTLNSGDYIIGMSSVTGGKTLTLPSAVTMGAGKLFVIKDQSGQASHVNYIRLSPQSGEKIDGQNSYDLNAAYESVTVVSDGSNWFIM